MTDTPTRTRPATDTGEVTMLAEMMDFLRATVVHKVSGLSDADAFTATVPPSTLTPAGVVKHLTIVERWWFSIDFANADVPEPEPGGQFDIEPGDTLAALVDAYVAECERSRQAIAGESLDELARGKDVYFNLRYALVHMIEETARHCGHLDLLRECIDGETGE
jgi:hypothetical protein